MDLSIVIPLFNEEESLPELCAWIERVMLANNYSYEVIMIDDGSTDSSWKELKSSVRRIKISKASNSSATMVKVPH